MTKLEQMVMAQEIMPSIQEDVKLTIVLLDNYGHASIGGLSEATGSDGFGTKFKMRNAASGQLDGDNVPTDLAANAERLGAIVLRPEGKEGLMNALAEGKGNYRTTVIAVEVDREVRVPGYESWWDVPIAEVSTVQEVQRLREEYVGHVARERYHL